MKYLVVVDMQNDFVDGSLGTKEAQAIVPEVAALVRDFDGTVIATMDTHEENYMDTEEGRNLPVPHCIRGTKGWEICPEVRAALDQRGDVTVLEKGTFGSRELAEFLRERGDAEQVVFCGLCTDICVISNALLVKAAIPEVPLAAVPACCAGVTPEKHAAALLVMQSCQVALC